MTSTHPDIDVVERFIRGSSTASEKQEIVAHLLSDCPECRGIAQAVWDQPIRVPSSVLREKLQKRMDLVEFERASALQLWEELQKLPQKQRQLLVHNSRRFQTWSLCEHLLKRAFELGFDTPAEALPITELAVDISLHVDPEEYTPELISDLRARALGYQANALRINSDLRSAERLLSQAFELLEEGTGDVLEQAELLRFQASLRCDQVRFRDAIKLQRRAVRLYRRLGDTPMEGRASISLGLFLSLDGRPEESVVVLRKAQTKLNPHETRWVLACRHNLALALRECSRLAEGLQVLNETRSLYASVGDKVSLLRMRWLEAQFARDLGNLAYAETVLHETCKDFVAQKLPADAALVCLELAELYSGQGRTREVRDLCEKLVRTFEALETPPQVLVAMTLLQRAVQEDIVTAAILSEIRERLETADAS